MTHSLHEKAKQIWQARLARFQASGLSVKDFCEQEKISTPSFYTWKKRFQNQSSSPQPQKPAFQQIQIQSTNTSLSIELANGTRIEVPTDQTHLVTIVLREVLAASDTHEEKP